MHILEHNNITVLRSTQGKLPSLPFVSIVQKILPKDFEITISFVSPSAAQELNQNYRGKDYIPNVLSFPLSASSGEMFLSLSTIRKEAPLFGYTYNECVLYMLIHGLLHIAGYDHGSEMEAQEKKYMALYTKEIGK